MKVCIYTLTRDRLEYTKRMLTQLKNCGISYHHIILDNGSQDGTPEWLKKNLTGSYDLILSPENKGLWGGIQHIKDFTNNFEGFDYVLKLDNDMEFPYDNWLFNLIGVYKERNYDVLSPFVEGVCNGAGGVPRISMDNGIGLVEHVGGACLLTTPSYYDEDLPDGYMATGWDTWFCVGLRCGIVEDIHVLHDSKKMEQENKEYHKRQRYEQTIKWKGGDRNLHGSF